MDSLQSVIGCAGARTERRANVAGNVCLNVVGYRLAGGPPQPAKRYQEPRMGTDFHG